MVKNPEVPSEKISGQVEKEKGAKEGLNALREKMEKEVHAKIEGIEANVAEQKVQLLTDAREKLGIAAPRPKEEPFIAMAEQRKQQGKLDTDFAKEMLQFEPVDVKTA